MTHHADPARVESFHRSLSGILDKLVQNALNGSSNLGPLMTKAFDLAACERVLGLAEKVPASIRLGVEAGLAIFTVAAVPPNQPVTYTLAGQTVTRPALVGADVAHIGRWEMVFYGASILRDADSLGAICSVPEALPLASPTAGENYLGLWFRVLRTLGASGAIDAELMVRALDATDPDRLPEDVRDAALYLRVPALEVLYRIALGDAAALEAALQSSLDKHRKYWTLDAEKQRGVLGYVSWPLSALAEVARGRGLSVETASDYLIRLPAAP
jgi:hypothetical protein